MTDGPLIFANPVRSRLRFTAGGALRATLDALGANLGPIVVLALIVVGVPILLVDLINANLHYGYVGRGLPPSALILAGVNFVTGILLEAAIARVVVTYLDRGRPRVADSLSSIAQVFLPLIGIALLSGLTHAARLRRVSDPCRDRRRRAPATGPAHSARRLPARAHRVHPGNLLLGALVGGGTGRRDRAARGDRLAEAQLQPDPEAPMGDSRRSGGEDASGAP